MDSDPGSSYLSFSMYAGGQAYDNILAAGKRKTRSAFGSGT